MSVISKEENEVLKVSLVWRLSGYSGEICGEGGDFIMEVVV